MPAMAPARGGSLIGLLVSMAILLVLALVGLRYVQRGMTGGGSTLPTTASSYADRQYLLELFRAMAAASYLSDDQRFLVPSQVAGGRDPTLNTTANLYSAMIAQQYTVPQQLVSGNENNPAVIVDGDYDFSAYAPASESWWDPRFKADLQVESNTSFAHVPLHGRRLRQQWRFTGGSRTALLGNRGPKDGLDDPSSLTCGRDGRWAGNLVYGDGHVEFLDTFVPPGLAYGDGAERFPDNLFAMEEGPDGGDAILTFTKIMNRDGPVIQHD